MATKSASDICKEVNPLLPDGFVAQCSIGVSLCGKSSPERVSVGFKKWLKRSESTLQQRLEQRIWVCKQITEIVHVLKTKGYKVFGGGSEATIIP